ncbi:hypothetical protein BB558_002420 [Smittium angustum]|uniref:TATA box binding protein associated factor (TAF) histone-like fold domain-containing protein n=1 Tax=Smittium angustum TaxID=133377 RepID=A0A2U1J8T8_SMIAN|nr:hypothetical protein BB558_005628 [Smittium angustum]PWA01501.1 hypothetical protein BB558_002420 [Smittium angustum]
MRPAFILSILAASAVATDSLKWKDAEPTDQLLWKDTITNPEIIKRIENMDMSTTVDKRSLSSVFDSVTKSISSAVYNLLWTVVAAESLGISKLKDDVSSALSQDIEYRIIQIVEDAKKFMRHSKRNKLLVSDINNALKVRNLEPVYGYELGSKVQYSSVSTAFEDIYYEEEEEIDLSTIINEPLPKIPPKVTYTTHWLAIEGVQPNIPQNPTSSEADDVKKQPLTTSAPETNNVFQNQTSSGTAPLVKHVLSKEHQLYFECVKDSLLSSEKSIQAAAYECVSTDSGIHQLVPYFVQLVSDLIIQNGSDLNTLNISMRLARALLLNDHLYIEPYIHQLLPSLMTCLLGKNLCNDYTENHWSLRDTAASLIGLLCTTYGQSYHTLMQRLSRTFIRSVLDPSLPLETHYGAIKGLYTLGPEAFRVLMIPNIKAYSTIPESELLSKNPGVVLAAEKVLMLLAQCLQEYAKFLKEKQLAGSQNEHQDLIDSGNLESKLSEAYGDKISSLLLSNTEFKPWLHLLLI